MGTSCVYGTMERLGVLERDRYFSGFADRGVLEVAVGDGETLPAGAGAHQACDTP